MPILAVTLCVVCLLALILNERSISSRPIVPPDLYMSFPLKEGKCPMVDVELGGRQWRFAVDTGSTHSSISSRVAKAVGVQCYRGVALYESAAPHYGVELKATLKSNLCVAGSTINNITWALMSKKNSRRFEGYVDGILGLDVLRNLIIRLDYGNKLGEMLGTNWRERISTENYEHIRMDPFAYLEIEIDNKKRRTRVDSGGEYTMMLRKKKPQTAWSADSIIPQGLAYGKGREGQLVVGSIPLVRLGNKTLANVAFEEQYLLFSNSDVFIGSYFLSEGVFILDFLDQACYFKFAENYQLSRQAASALKLRVDVSINDQNGKTSGKIEVKSIHEKNPLATEYGIRQYDRIVSVDGESLIVASTNPQASDFYRFVDTLVHIRFKTLSVQRGDSVLVIYNQKRTGRERE